MTNKKQQPTRLTPKERQERRQKQIDLGKDTVGYQNLTVLREQGKIRAGPRTPDPTVELSKRQFDKKIREWRRKLHAFDDVIFDQKQGSPEFHTPEFREWSKTTVPSRANSTSPSSVSSDALRSGKNSLSPALDSSYLLRRRLEDTVYRNRRLEEQVLQYRILVRRLEDDLGHYSSTREFDIDQPLHTLDRFDNFRNPDPVRSPWEPEPRNNYRAWEDDTFKEHEPFASKYLPWKDKRFHGDHNLEISDPLDTRARVNPDRFEPAHLRRKIEVNEFQLQTSL